MFFFLLSIFPRVYLTTALTFTNFITLNVNGLRDPNKRMALLQSLGHLSVHIACLQETHCTSSREAQQWFSSYGFSSIVSPGSVHSCGSVILYRPSFTLTNSWTDEEGRFAMAEFKKHEVTFRVACVYAPNRNPARDDFFQTSTQRIDPSVPTVVCGDFNTVFDRTLDRRGSDPSDYSRESSQALASLFQECCILDTWRYLHRKEIAFSWLSRDGFVSSRIDFVGCPYQWIHAIESCDILPCPYSDHSIVLMSLVIPEPIPKGPGRWLFNISLLKDEDFVNAIKDFWADWSALKAIFPTIQKWWEVGKAKIKRLAIAHGTARKKAAADSRALLDKLAAHLKAQIDVRIVTLLPVYQNVLAQIATIDQSIAEGAKVRSRIRWAEEGETSSSFFFRLEKKQKTESWISAMKRPDGSIASHIYDICDSWVHFYSDLFTASPVDLTVQQALLDNLSSTIPAHETALCDGPLTVDEVRIALLGMATGKTPGSDGLPMEFYITFWDVLGPDLVEVLNASYDAGTLPVSQRQALISLLYKKGDRLLHKNWRPISLLNVDYKLCARALAGRLLKVIHHVVGSDQTCGVPGRYIGENVALLRDVTTIANELNLPVAILSLDQEKAFDRVDWDFLLATLTKMGFGSSFRRWIKLLYMDIFSAVLIDGHQSHRFRPSRG